MTDVTHGAAIGALIGINRRLVVHFVSPRV